MTETSSTSPVFRGKDLTGTVFGRLTVLSFSGWKSKWPQWQCQCVCGKVTTAFGGNLRSGNTKSCGCWLRDIVIIRSTIHGHKGTRTYAAWCAMKSRCDNPNNPAYGNYGARGITYCERWKSFVNFLEDMGDAPEGLELERVDNEKGYDKANCIWDTTANQNRNRRDSVKITIDGVTKNQSVWCREAGISTSAYNGRIKRGWDTRRALFEKTLTMPAQRVS